MNYKIVFKEEASQDVFDAMRWYESRQIGLGKKLFEEIEEHLGILEREPQLFQIRRNNLRYCPLRRFPYIIVYEIKKI